MADSSNLLNEIDTLLGGVNVSYTSASATNDLYEGFVFALVIQAAKAAGASVTYETVHGAPTSDLVFRTSPGMLYSVVQPYTHAVLQFDKLDALEVHVGVRVQGRSKVLHECDVLVLSQSEAALSRGKSVAPRGSKCLLAVECKFYASPLGLALAREFHGLHSDLAVQFPHFVSNLRSRSVERLLTSLRRKWEGDVRPSAKEATYLEGAFREAFKHYQTMQGSIVS